MSDKEKRSAEDVSPQSTAKGAMGLGVAFLLFGLYVSAFLVPDVINAWAGAQPLSLVDAAKVASDEQTYARLTDGSWDCDTLTYVEGYSPSHRYGSPLEEDTKVTEIFFTDEGQDIVVFITMSGERDCDDLPNAPSGYLYEMQNRTERELTNDARLARYFDADSLLEMCGYCGRDNSLIGAGFGIASIVGGLALIVFGWQKMRKVNH
ncbi:MAG: hypothetical protein AAFN11_05170 [Chloroflexota bacterium]